MPLDLLPGPRPGPPLDPLLYESATRLAARIRAREVTSREVVEAHIRRIRAVNPRLNAVVRERFAEARAEADAADVSVQEGRDSLPPLHGVPCTIKESNGVAGMPWSSGLVARRDVIAERDGSATARLRGAGAIPLGVTNVSELCMWMESKNRVYGRTANAYDARRTAGGSSGGEGAIVGAGGSPFGLGADIGGSIRMPAFFNGVFGHKPTGGLVPSTGQYPMPGAGAARYNTTGPLCRRAEDLMPLLAILAGPDGEDPGCREGADGRPGDPSTVRIDQLTVLDVADNGTTPVSAELRAGQRAAAAALRARGASGRDERFPELKRSLAIWSCMVSAGGGPSFAELLGNGTAVRPGRELWRWATRRSPHTLPAIGLCAIERIPDLFGGGKRQTVERGLALARDLAARLGPTGVMLYPSYATTAPRHGVPLLMPMRWVYTAIFNVLEFPVTQVPLGLSKSGLPLGVQVVGAPGCDHVTIAVALALERDFGGWVPPAA